MERPDRAPVRSVPPAPDIAAIVRELRQAHGLTLEELAERSGLSASFLSAVERGTSDIAFGRLVRLAAAFELEVGALIGHHDRRDRPLIVDADALAAVSRGPGIDYRQLLVAGVEIQLVVVTLDPRSGFADALAHRGVDVLYVVEGAIVLTWDGDDHHLAAGQVGVWPGERHHSFRNDADVRARFVAVSSHAVWGATGRGARRAVAQ